MTYCEKTVFATVFVVLAAVTVMDLSQHQMTLEESQAWYRLKNTLDICLPAQAEARDYCSRPAYMMTSINCNRVPTVEIPYCPAP